MITAILACSIAVLEVTQYMPADINNPSLRDIEKCSKGVDCFVITNDELLSSLKRAHRAGRTRALEDANRGALAARLNDMEAENAEMKKLCGRPPH